MKLIELKEYIPNCTDKQLAQFEQYALLLQEWNEKMNLTAITEMEEIVEKHFYDCLLPFQYIKIEGKIVDVGSGAGFPGLVWKIAYPDLDITLLEPIQKRCTFLKEVIKQLGLEKIKVVNARAEDFAKDARETYDYASARAIARQNILSELCMPLIKVGGHMISLKGMKGVEESEEAKKASDTLGVQLIQTIETELPSQEKRVILVYKKVKKTPEKYPRNYGAIKKKPL